MRERRTPWRLVTAGLALAALGRALAESPAVVDGHRTSVLPFIAGILQPVFGGFESTVGEVLAVLAIAAALIAVVRMKAFGAGLVGFALGLTVLAFYGSWGLGYWYPPLGERLLKGPLQGDAEESRIQIIGLAERAARLVDRASRTVVDFSGDDARLLARINLGLSAGFARLPASIEASPVRGVRFGPAKPSRVSFALSRLQLSGFYFPWTGEAQINIQMPRSQWPRVAAHEKAHQRGFARENEASVIGILACLASPDPAVFYGGTLGLFAAFDRELARLDRQARRRIWGLLPLRAVADFEAEAAFWRIHEGVAADVSEKVNDTYLKAQGVSTGVNSYGETTRLMLQALATPGLDLARLLAEAGPEPFTK